jgi:glycosyltransferase involved in cell wall biosynthesis
LAAPYANVALHGFVDDVVPFYQSSDLQVVASTDASGLRTRIIESFAYGLPVMSTSVGARGIAGLKAGEHFMVADDAAQFAIGLTRLLDSPGMLERFSQSGQEFYEKHQSRATVATALSQCLQKHFGISAAR